MSEDCPTDAQIIALSLDHPSEFGEIFKRHRVAIYKFAAKRVGPQDAEDVVSRVFEKAFSVRDRYAVDRSNCLPWLYGIAVNVVGDHIRKQRVAIYVYPIDQVEGQVAGSDPSPEAEVLNAGLSDDLNEALSRLPVTSRDALLLHVLEEMSYVEISEALEVPIATVGSKIHRAKRKLVTLLGEITNPGSDSQEEEVGY